MLRAVSRMSDDSPATAYLDMGLSSSAATKKMTETNVSFPLGASPLDSSADSWVLMTTDGGNDTEPEEEDQEGAALVDELKTGNKTSPKKRAAANTGDEETSPKKKRAPAKSRVAAKASEEATETGLNDKKKRSATAKAAGTGDEVAIKSEDETAEGLGSSTERPSTPKAQTIKESKIPKTPKTPKSPEDDNVVEANNTTPKPAKAKTHAVRAKVIPKQSPAKGKRAGAEKVAEKVVLPTKWSEASEADKTLVAMKEAGHPWSEIRTKWFEMTGQDTASSTLPNRYKRLQVIMMELQDGEKEILLAAKAAIEANWKNSLWTLVAAKMEELGARKLPTDFLMKEFRKMEAAGATDATPATIGAYAPTSPVASRAQGSSAANGKVKTEDAEEEAKAGADVLLAAANEAMAGDSEIADDEAADEDATE
ncbi:MAG: hypothetical protein Q9169_000988 [Polycauliona sp. 2 TL-2023]